MTIKKLLASITLVSFFLLSLVSPFVNAVNAQAPWYFPEYDEWYIRVHDTANPDEIFGERYTQAQVVWVIYSLVAFLISGLGNQNLIVCVMQNVDDPVALAAICGPILDDITSYNIQRQENANVYALLRPNNTINYIKGVGEKLSIVPEVKAQQPGFGFGALSPVQRLWALVRNLTYFLLVIAVVVMAFMIMFRTKISPQTVITVQSALPKIVIALILITFSYAIAGFLIDLMYVVIGLIAAILANSGLVTGADTEFATMFNNLTSRAGGILAYMFAYFLTFILIAIVAIFSNVIGILALIGIARALWASGSAGFVILLILFVIILIVLVIIMFRIWFMLIKAFVNVLLLTVIAPVQILLGMFGGGGFGAWVRNLVANLAVFPTTGVMIFLAFFFLGAAIPQILDFARPYLARILPFNPDPNALGPSGWTPPLTWGSTDLDILWLATSVIILTLIPKIADIIKALIQGRPFAYGVAIGEALAVPTAVGTAAFWGGVGRGSELIRAGGGPVTGWFNRRLGLKAGGDTIASRILSGIEYRAARGGR